MIRSIQESNRAQGVAQQPATIYHLDDSMCSIDGIAAKFNADTGFLHIKEAAGAANSVSDSIDQIGLDIT